MFQSLLGSAFATVEGFKCKAHSSFRPRTRARPISNGQVTAHRSRPKEQTLSMERKCRSAAKVQRHMSFRVTVAKTSSVPTVWGRAAVAHRGRQNGLFFRTRGPAQHKRGVVSGGSNIYSTKRRRFSNPLRRNTDANRQREQMPVGLVFDIYARHFKTRKSANTARTSHSTAFPRSMLNTTSPIPWQCPRPA